MDSDVSKGCGVNPKGEEVFLGHLTIGYESATILKTLRTMHPTTQHMHARRPCTQSPNVQGAYILSEDFVMP